MPTQTQVGKAFEYAIVEETYRLLSPFYALNIKENNAYKVAKNCFNLFEESVRTAYLKAASAAIRHIVDLEPHLQNASSQSDLLIIQIASDSEGIGGDVRDVIFSCPVQNWQVGVSAKNNHTAVKHSRLSTTIDFGKEWLQLACSEEYFNTIRPIFEELRLLKKQNILWKDLKDKEQRFYIPILEAFKKELFLLDKLASEIVPIRLLKYLIGQQDFYKVIKGKNKTQIYGFHLYGSLNKRFGDQSPKFKVPKVRLPTRIIEIVFKPGSSNTILLTCNEGWQISFRIHNASSRVEPSLKFDINLIGQPQNLYSHHVNW